MSCRMGCIVTPAITPQSEGMARTVATFWLVIPNIRDLPIYALLYPPDFDRQVQVDLCR